LGGPFFPGEEGPWGEKSRRVIRGANQQVGDQGPRGVSKKIGHLVVGKPHGGETNWDT